MVRIIATLQAFFIVYINNLAQIIVCRNRPEMSDEFATVENQRRLPKPSLDR